MKKTEGYVIRKLEEEYVTPSHRKTGGRGQRSDLLE